MNEGTETVEDRGRLADFKCPVCGKARPHPDADAECTRCGAGLADAVRVRKAALDVAAWGLRALPREPGRAIAHLEAAYRLHPDSTAARRLACAYLLDKQYHAALRWRQIAAIPRSGFGADG